MKTKVLVWKKVVKGNYNPITAEQMLNQWLEENKNIDIKHITQSESGEVAASSRITYTIWYQ